MPFTFFLKYKYSPHASSFTVDPGRAICASPPGVNSESLRAPQCGQGIKSMESGSVCDARSGRFIDQAACRETFEAEVSVQRMRLAVRERMREYPTGTGRRLEAAGTPSAVNV